MSSTVKVYGPVPPPVQLRPQRRRQLQPQRRRQRQQQRRRQRQQQPLPLQAATHVSTTYSWNQTGVVVADTNSNPVSDPRCIYVVSDDTIYTCAHSLGYVQKWVTNTTSRTAVTTNTGDHIDYISFDKDGYMYTNAHDANLVRRYPPNSSTGTIVAGSGSSVSGSLNYPKGTAVDENFTLYIADRDNDRVAKLEQNATSVVTAISTSGIISKPSALVLSIFSSNQVYISDEDGKGVYLWTFGASAPSVNLTQVTCNDTLDKPRGIKLDTSGNLFVADHDNKRVVMYCVNSTMGTVILSLSDEPRDVALDSAHNLYVIVAGGKAYKYTLL
ncbi:unnamed protein product [Rotaria sordida]|uniref:Uncharacterized protein n=1 Tax=Rotaria sordida TaxID=392033 RepID=A0A815TVH7_9BILA|nr:unnamed protein product [Rotaria sordida]CAF1509160.1 unnamed protein product [Rotaria sordida]